MRPGEGQGTLWEMWGGKEPVSIPHSSTRTGVFPFSRAFALSRQADKRVDST